jgi:hypothetical protein
VPDRNPNRRNVGKQTAADDAARDLLTKAIGAQAAIARLKKVAALTHCSLEAQLSNMA